MATTKIIPEVLDLRGGLPDYSLAATNTVSYLNAGGGNQYNFNGAYGLYGVVNGTFVLSSVSSSHPIAILNNGKTSLISYTGAVNEGSQTGPDGNTYTYYSGDVTITVSGNFDVVSYACKVHGYMGGQNNLIYTNLHSDLGLKIPTGTNNNRPATDVAGMIRNNTNETSASSASCEEYYNGTTWQKINVLPLPIVMDFLVVAGGGGGGCANGAGGAGAGGLRASFGSTSGGGGGAESSLNLTNGVSYIITVGAGGSAPFGAGAGASGNNGSDSVFSTITSLGGGGGAHETNTSKSGGCGGGAGTFNVNSPVAGGAGTANQGFAGGSGDFNGATRYGGGGGGTSAVGEDGRTSNSNGGAGLAVSITGASVTYGGGGGGNGNVSGTGAPGAGGGGNGYQYPTTNSTATAGTTNLGGGGGGGAYQQNGGAGGSGVVILRLATSQYSGTTSGSPTVTTDGSDTILTYTGSGTYTA